MKATESLAEGGFGQGLRVTGWLLASSVDGGSFLLSMEKFLFLGGRWCRSVTIPAHRPHLMEPGPSC